MQQLGVIAIAGGCLYFIAGCGGDDLVAWKDDLFNKHYKKAQYKNEKARKAVMTRVMCCMMCWARCTSTV